MHWLFIIVVFLNIIILFVLVNCLFSLFNFSGLKLCYLLILQQAITALKKGAYLLKYGRRGKPKFCPFRLANVSLLDCLDFMFSRPFIVAASCVHEMSLGCSSTIIIIFSLLVDEVV